VPTDQAKLVIFLLAVAFAAGGYVAALRTARKQINGLGAKVHRLQLALLLFVPEDRKKELVEIFLGKKN
jgi:hypothetical protein